MIPVSTTFFARRRLSEGDIRPGAHGFEFEAESPEGLLKAIANDWGRYTSRDPRAYQYLTTVRTCRASGIKLEKEAAFGDAIAFLDFLRRQGVIHLWQHKTYQT